MEPRGPPIASWTYPDPSVTFETPGRTGQWTTLEMRTQRIGHDKLMPVANNPGIHAPLAIKMPKYDFAAPWCGGHLARGTPCVVWTGYMCHGMVAGCNKKNLTSFVTLWARSTTEAEPSAMDGTPPEWATDLVNAYCSI